LGEAQDDEKTGRDDRCGGAGRHRMKDAKAVTLKVTSASTYVRRNGKWWSVLYQETPTP
jgi:hypothetical protein